MWECDRLNIPYSGNSSVNVKVSCYEIVATDSVTGERIYGDPILPDYDVDIPTIVEYGSYKGVIEFAERSIIYNPYRNWKDYDDISFAVDLGSDDPGIVDISFTAVDSYQCPHNRTPKQNYTRVGINNSGPVVPTNVECVLPIHIADQGVAAARPEGGPVPNGDESPSKGRMSYEDTCKANGLKWNIQAGTPPGTGECQTHGIPDPFFRKNYISEGN